MAAATIGWSPKQRCSRVLQWARVLHRTYGLVARNARTAEAKSLYAKGTHAWHGGCECLPVLG